MPTIYDVLFFTSSAELKMELLREKEVREGLEKQLVEEQKSRGTFMDPHLKCLKWWCIIKTSLFRRQCWNAILTVRIHCSDFSFTAMLLRRIKKEKRARRKLQEQMGGNQTEENKNSLNDTASVTSQDSDKNVPGQTPSPVLLMQQGRSF